MTLKTAMQRGSREMRDRRLQGVQAVIKRQQSVPAERNHDGFFLDRQDRGLWLSRTCRQIVD